MGLRLSKHAATGSLSLEEVARRPKLSSSEVADLHLVSHTMYATFSLLAYSDKKDLICPEGWEVFRDCTSVHLDCEGYYAVAFINRASKHCVIAQRGTSEVLALRAGVWVYFEEPTIQFYLAEQFSRQVRLGISLLPDAKEWVVSYTGHSLGAVLAACRAVEENTFAVTFESPGSFAFLKKNCKEFRASMDSSIIAYVRPPNPINTLKPHSGYMVMLPFTNADGSPSTSKEDASLSTNVVPPMILRQAADAPPELAARSPIMSVLPPASVGSAAQGRTGEPAQVTAAPVASAKPDSAQRAAAATAGPLAAGAKGAAAPSRFNPMRFKFPSIRPQGYLRDYILGGVSFGIPELQQYVSKVEPMIRELLERTQQLHSIHGILEHFLRREKGESAGQEMVVLRWPTHFMQFMEYYNTVRALEDSDKRLIHVVAAYTAMMRHFYAVEPRPTDTIPLRYISASSRQMVQLWWSLDAAARKALPLSPLEHKALNCMKIDGDSLRVTVLEPFQAKQFLDVLIHRHHIAPINSRSNSTGSGESSVTATVVTSKL